jgi:serine/threonine protein kinase
MVLEPGAVVGGKYRIERALARGGMGSVWVARHVQLGSTVALKFLDATFATSAAHRVRFEREARSAANLKSPHVVQVMDYGFEADAPYLVMELLEGEDLGQRLHRIGRMSLPDTARVLLQVGKALRKAHDAGIAHRDLKPANLFIARVDDDEVVKVLDFGIAKEQHAAVGDATKTGEIMGSPHYMSPEQVRAEKDLDHRTDIWSMGVILYRMLAGDLPFPGDQIGPVLAKILTDPIPQITRVAPDLPPAIDQFFLRALARDKAHRFHSIGEMVDAFQLAAGSGVGLPAMSVGTGNVGAPLASGAPPWGARPQGATVPLGPSGSYGAAPGQSGPITGSALGTNGGVVTTGSAVTTKGNGALIAALAAAFVFAALAVGGFFLLRSSSSVASSGTPDPVGTAQTSPTLTPVPEPSPPASATSSSTPEQPATPPTTAPSTTSATPVAKPIGSSPKTKAPSKPAAASSTTTTKEKWF